jgi:ABC-type antimicrobial peptide transport system permease subunit
MGLNDFAYHTIISPGAFVTTLITMLFMAFATVSYQTFSAAFINPAKLLRND